MHTTYYQSYLCKLNNNELYNGTNHIYMFGKCIYVYIYAQDQ